MPNLVPSSFISIVLDFYATLFAKKSLARINKFLFLAGARGLGVLNYKHSNLNGEEPFLIRFLADYDSNKFLVLDVGANKGQFAEVVIKNTKNINVRSYEPNPHACRDLKSNPLFRTNRHTLVEMGASNTISESLIYDYKSGLGSSHSSLYSEVITDIHKSEQAIPEKVALTTLDSDLKELNPNIAILKIDTEGHEKAVLEGSKRILSANSPIAILIEFNEMNAVSGTHFRDIINLLGASYAPYRLLPGGSLLPLSKMAPLFTEIYAYQNLVFLRRDPSANVELP